MCAHSAWQQKQSADAELAVPACDRITLIAKRFRVCHAVNQNMPRRFFWLAASARSNINYWHRTSAARYIKLIGADQLYNSNLLLQFIFVLIGDIVWAINYKILKICEIVG